MSVVTLERTDAEAAYAEAFRAAQRGADARQAFARFEAAGVPSRRWESWHYTDLRRTLQRVAPFAAPFDAARVEEVRLRLGERLGAVRFVLIDGRFAPELSDPAPAGVALRPGAPALDLGEGADPMLSLAGALAEGGLSLETPEGGDLGRVEIVHALRPGASSASHVQLSFGAGARGAVIERTLGAGAGAQRHRLASFALGAGAEVEHVVVVEDETDIEIESLRVNLEREAQFSSFALVASGALVRRQIFARLAGERASLALAGLSLIAGGRHADTTLEVNHAAPHGKSREFFRHIVADASVGVYQGKVIVAPHAQKTDGAMKSQALLLSPTAQMHNKPELEIFADDVVCGHGATVGALDREQIFYLRARGIPEREAEAMLLEAFGVDAIARVADEALRDALSARLRVWLKGRAA